MNDERFLNCLRRGLLQQAAAYEKLRRRPDCSPEIAVFCLESRAGLLRIIREIDRQQASKLLPAKQKRIIRRLQKGKS